MAIGFAYNGVCYPDGVSAHVAFQKNFNVTGEGHISTLTSSSVSGAIPVISYSVSTRSLDNATAPVARTGSFTLRPCDYSFFQTPDIPDLLVISVLFFAAMIGFGQGFKP